MYKERSYLLRKRKRKDLKHILGAKGLPVSFDGAGPPSPLSVVHQKMRRRMAAARRHTSYNFEIFPSNDFHALVQQKALARER